MGFIAVVKAFLQCVSFPTRDTSGSSVAEAFLHMADDADGHEFRVAVPSGFALEVAKLVKDDNFNDEDPRVLIALMPCAMRKEDGAPTMAQLLAVWHASSFVDDVARDRRCCGVCDRRLPDTGPFDADTRVPCSPDCPGAELRAARRLVLEEP